MPNTKPVASSTIQHFNGLVQSLLETLIVSRSHTAITTSFTYVLTPTVFILDEDKINLVV